MTWLPIDDPERKLTSDLVEALGRRMSAPKWQPGDYCDRCNNTGEVDCHCGGDLCVCGEQELECPQCHGNGGCDAYGDDDDY